jgi:hypothetical protein
MAALREETRLVATARPGTRNDTLNRAAFSLGQLVASAYCPRWLSSPLFPARPNGPGYTRVRRGAPSAQA